MTFNRIVDVHIDGANPRTSNRALPLGRITLGQAWWFWLGSFVLLTLACLGFTWFDHNPWPLRLVLPVTIYLCGYSYCKRFTKWSHFYLGSAIALSPLAAWLAIDPHSLGLPAVFLAAAVTLWIGGFDIIYACQDIELDRQLGLFSLPANWGAARALWVARIAHVLTVVFLVILGVQSSLGWLYWMGVVVVAILLIFEHSLVHPHDFSKVNVAFFTINGVVSVCLGIAAVSDILLELPPLIQWAHP